MKNGKMNGSGSASVNNWGRAAQPQNHVATVSARNVSTQGDTEHEYIVALPAARLPGENSNGNENGLPPIAWLVRVNGERIPLVRVDVKLVCDAE